MHGTARTKAIAAYTTDGKLRSNPLSREIIAGIATATELQDLTIIITAGMFK
jgi:hypothetical protein